MQEIDTTHERIPAGSEEPLDDAVSRRRLGLFHWRYVVVYLILIGLILLAVLPPLVNVSRFKRRIVTSISTSIGRPVHLDNVSLVLLPFPGFKLENFVVEEAPAFGAEPVIHANNVVGTLRVSSLWRRKVEFSRISLQEPSINLVRTPDGKWNVESILLQAARIPAAPTAQAKAGADPRFPYIEATGARVNIKYGDEKLPLSLTEADFSLWLPKPMQWRVRIEGKPSRTDTSASDTGTVSLEGTLGRAERFDEIPIDLTGEWKNAPLGEASLVAMGRDAGLRGELRLKVTAQGTVGENAIKALLQLRGARRAEFVPPQALDMRADCQATATERFHALHDVRCSWPSPAAPSVFALTAEIPDVSRAGTASFELGAPGLPASMLLDWLRIVSPRVSPEIAVKGGLTGKLTHELGESYSGHVSLKGATLTGGPIGDSPIALGDVAVSSGAPTLAVARGSRKGTKAAAPSESSDGVFVMAPATVGLGGKDPAQIEGTFDRNGYSLHLYGNVLQSRLMALAGAIPQFGDGLQAAMPVSAAAPAKESPIHIDVTSSRVWGGGQSWVKTQTKPARPSGKARR